MRNNSIICLGAGVSQLPLIQAAKRRGYNVIAIDRNPKAPGFLLADIKIVESTYDTAKVLNALHSFEKRHHFIGLVARASGPALKTAAAIAEEFHLPGLSREIVPLATEKSRLREFCKSHGILMPKGQKISQIEELDPNFPMPLIVKPDLPLIGKKDVRVVWELSDLELAVKSAIQSSGNDFAEVEEYIDGVDVGCLFHANKGKCTVKTFWDELVGVRQNGNILGLGVSVPSVIVDSAVEPKIRSIAKSLASFFTSINALLILALRIDLEGNIYIIELHADLGGDLIAEELFPLANSSFDYFEYCISVALNDDSKSMEPMFSPSAILYISDCFKEKVSFDKVIALKHNGLGLLHQTIIEYYDAKRFYKETVSSHLKFYKSFGGNDVKN
ncbi:MAG: hypothetical protein JRJ57_03940 [Deltaproteobacteria bacterium]|nr:hypothetical protein [Deltaproteobacteria bacterium]